MTPERFERVREILEAALARPAGDRARFLEEACGADAELREEVESLIAHEAGAKEYLEKPLLGPELTVGRHLAHYEILKKLASGGMGDVYLAEDTKLERKVALKVLPPELAEDGDRLARFQREAKAVAALDHPNIVQVFSVEQAEGVHFITMQLVSGKTLAELQPRKGFALETFFQIAIPLADAVAVAHEHGVVHRDLKPANVMVSDGGDVKVLDFGLARSAVSVGAATDSALSTAARTEEGLIIGTPSYMSPEQAEGRPVDPRTDLFSLGAIFYEMLTGRRPFGADTAGAVLAAVAKDAPTPIRELRPEISRDLARVVGRCLNKDRDRRFQTALDVRNELEESKVELDAPEMKPSVVSGSSSASRWLAAALTLSVLALVAALMRPVPRDARGPSLVNARQLTSASGAEDDPTWSPDGGRIAYQSGGDIWVLQLAGGAPVNLTASPEAIERRPAWSPDGSQIAFQSDRDGGGVFVMPAVGGASRKLLDLDGPPVWSPDGGEIGSFSGPAADLTFEIQSLRTQQSRKLPIGRRCGQPTWSPDGRYLACVDSLSLVQFRELWLYPLSGEEPVLVTAHAISPTWSADGTRLYFVSPRGGSRDLWMLPLEDGAVTETPPRAVTSGLVLRGAAFSRDGTRLAYSVGRRIAQLWRVPSADGRLSTWEDAQQLTFDFASAIQPDISADGRIVLSSDRGGNPDLWTLPAEGGEMLQLTSDPALDRVPSWSPDADRLAFASERSGDRSIWLLPSSGGLARNFMSHPARDSYPIWSPDGTEVVFLSDRSGNPDLWIASSDGGAPRPLTTHPAIDQQPDWSPDGSSVVFQSWRLGPDGGPPYSFWRVAAAGGEPELVSSPDWDLDWAFRPRWSPDGSRLFFICKTQALCEMPLDDGKERVVADLSGKIGRPQFDSLATDGEFLYFSWAEEVGDLWVMDVVPGDDAP